VTAQDVLELQPVDLSEELDITREEAFEIIQVIKAAAAQASATKPKGPTSAAPHTAQELLLKEADYVPITTFCFEWDEMLGGGVPLTKITELCGAPGVGKTQLG
jgi:RAD51-like protein 2